jgi:ketosteroid isomerase-like protein
MSQENVRTVRRGYEAWQRTRKLEYDLLDPDVEWVLYGTPAGDVIYRGRVGVRKWFAEQDAAWSDKWWEVESVRETPDGRVLALVVAHAVGRGSGIPVTLPLANIWTLEEGRATRMEMFMDRGEALEAAGLSK